MEIIRRFVESSRRIGKFALPAAALVASGCLPPSVSSVKPSCVETPSGKQFSLKMEAVNWEPLGNADGVYLTFEDLTAGSTKLRLRFFGADKTNRVNYSEDFTGQVQDEITGESLPLVTGNRVRFGEVSDSFSPTGVPHDAPHVDTELTVNNC